MQEFYIGQKFHYYIEGVKRTAKLIKINGDMLYFKNGDGVCFEGLKYYVGYTIFPDYDGAEKLNKKAVQSKKNYKFKKPVRKQDWRIRDRNQHLDVYWDNIGKPGTQKGID